MWTPNQRGNGRPGIGGKQRFAAVMLATAAAVAGCGVQPPRGGGSRSQAAVLDALIETDHCGQITVSELDALAAILVELRNSGVSREDAFVMMLESVAANPELVDPTEGVLCLDEVLDATYGPN